MRKMLLLAALPLLMACNRTQMPNRVGVDFGTSSTIMRGTWSAEYMRASQQKSVTISVSPTYLDETSYKISGTGSFEDEDVTVEGTVTSGVYSYIRAQTSPAPQNTSELKFIGKRSGETTVYCGAYTGVEDLFWSCYASGTSFTLKKQK